MPRHCAALVKLRSSVTVTRVRNSSVGMFVMGYAAAWRRGPAPDTAPMVFLQRRPDHFRSVKNSEIFFGGLQELARIPPWRRNAPKTAAEGAENRLYSGAQLFRERAAASGLSNTITLDTKALRSRAWTRPQAEPIAPKSSSR